MRIVGIHGINQHRSTRVELVEAWTGALEAGLVKAGLVGSVAPLHLDVAYYADLYVTHRVQWKSLDDPAAELDEVAQELILEWDASGLDHADSLDDAGRFEHTEPGAGAVEIKGLSVPATPLAVQAAVHRLAASPGLQGFGVTGVRRLARHLHAYLCYEDARELTAARVTEAIGDGVDVLIGHSMGSVVAYEWLHNNPDRQPPLLITIGSPLGCGPVRSRLRPPASVPGSGRWVNLAATHDPIAWPKRLADVFGSAVEDDRVPFRFWAHSARTYLQAAQTAAAVASVAPETPT